MHSLVHAQTETHGRGWGRPRGACRVSVPAHGVQGRRHPAAVVSTGGSFSASDDVVPPLMTGGAFTGSAFFPSFNRGRRLLPAVACAGYPVRWRVVPLPRVTRLNFRLASAFHRPGLSQHFRPAQERPDNRIEPAPSHCSSPFVAGWSVEANHEREGRGSVPHQRGEIPHRAGEFPNVG